ncbi:MAG TPA: hypothetical protein VFR21_12520 [Bradyrhizobium sp.]|jgi:hypothetical protein|nr:hypothetical protein [Bradyrhizobium sp.]
MNNHLIKIVSLAALINARAAIAQTNPPMMSEVATQLKTVGSTIQADSLDPRLSAPVGHRQPRLTDVRVGEAGKLDPIEAESAAIDRKLTICRGC